MKKITLIAVTLSFVFGPVVPAAGRKSEQTTSPRAHQFTPQSQPKNETEAKTFMGTIWMNGGQFVLRDETKRTWYQLDDSDPSRNSKASRLG